MMCLNRGLVYEAVYWCGGVGATHKGDALDDDQVVAWNKLDSRSR